MAKTAEAIAQKVRREGAPHLRRLDFVADDAFTLIRQALATYHLLFYLNADEYASRTATGVPGTVC